MIEMPHINYNKIELKTLDEIARGTLPPGRGAQPYKNWVDFQRRDNYSSRTSLIRSSVIVTLRNVKKASARKRRA